MKFNFFEGYYIDEQGIIYNKEDKRLKTHSF